MAAVRKPRYQEVEGFIIMEMFDPQCFREALQYKARPDDVFIVTYPKCGTTWTQTILQCIFLKGDPERITTEKFALDCYLELVGSEGIEKMKRPGAIKTHLPFHLQPYSPNAKYVYVVRNPKDCCASFYHHTKNIPGYDFVDGTFDDFFELFINGEVDFGDYFQHVLSWYRHRNDPNVLFLTYEDMKEDTRGAVKKIARFLGKEYGDLVDNDPAVMDRILHYSSFQYMKESVNADVKKTFKKLSDEEIDKLPIAKGLKYVVKYTNKMKLNAKSKEINFVRKGVVGDWRSVFSQEQSKRMDEKFAAVLGHTELAELWRKEMQWQ